MLSDHKHLIYEIIKETPPLVFVDDNPGYICYFPQSVGYRSTSITYNGIKEAGGLNFYSSRQSIGGGFFIGGNLFSLTNVRLNDWFGLDLGRDVSSEIFFAGLVSEYEVMVACIANVDPKTNKVIYTSKTIDTRSMLLAASTYFYPDGTKTSSIEEHQSKFNDSLVYIGEGGEDKYFDDLIYNGAYGFSDKTTKILEIGSQDKNGRVAIMNETMKDLTSLMEINPALFVDKQMYDAETARNKDGVVMLVGVSATSVQAASKDKATAKEFANPMLTHDLDNVKYGRIMSIPSSKKTSKKVPTYYPTGIFYNDIPNTTIIINRLESRSVSEGEEEEIKVFGAEYVFDLKIIENEIVISTRSDENQKSTPTTLSMFDLDLEAEVNIHRNSILGKVWSLNIIPVKDSDTLGRVLTTSHKYAAPSTIPNQVFESRSVKSMAIARQYFSFS